MAEPNRFTQTVYALSTRLLFHCGGLEKPSERADRWGQHDLFFLTACATLAGAWYFFLYTPQVERNALLAGRITTTQARLKIEETETRRLNAGIHALQTGDPAAWERAARAKLSWLKPGETTDSERLKQAGRESALAERMAQLAAQAERQRQLQAARNALAQQNQNRPAAHLPPLPAPPILPALTWSPVAPSYLVTPYQNSLRLTPRPPAQPAQPQPPTIPTLAPWQVQPALRTVPAPQPLSRPVPQPAPLTRTTPPTSASRSAPAH